MKTQPIVYACGHRDLIHYDGTPDEGRELARIISVARCPNCDPSTSVVRWYDRIGLDRLFATSPPSALREDKPV